MRIATNQQSTLMLNHAQRTYANWNKAQVQVSTGMKYESLSENTVAAARILSLNHSIAGITRTEANIDEASYVLSTVESYLSSMNDVLQRINDLTLQAANGTSSVGDIQEIKLEIDELINQVVGYANASDKGMYLFGGANFSKEPFVFDAETGMYEYMGSTKNVIHHISDGYSVDVLRNGESLVKVLNNLQGLSQILGEVAREEIHDFIDETKKGITTVSGMLTNVGSSLSGLNTHKTAVSSQRMILESRLSNIQEVDQTQAITDVSLTKYAYEATLSMISQMSRVSILNYL